MHLVPGLRVSEAAPRQRTDAAVQAAAQAPARPAAPPARLQLGLDATKVPLVHGAWTDVKLAAFADLVPGPPDEDGCPTARAVNLSYVARWEPAERFGQTITPEAQRGGPVRPGRVDRGRGVAALDSEVRAAILAASAMVIR